MKNTMKRPSAVARLATLAVLALAIAPGCQSSRLKLERMYRATLDQSSRRDGLGGLTPSYIRDQTSRIERVLKLREKSEIESAADHFHAAVVLLRSDNLGHLALSEEHGRLASSLGETRGLRVAAEAIDRHALMLDQPQPYGTQFVYVAVLERWELYAIAPETTDAERIQMGVEPLATLRARERELNESEALRVLGSGR